MDDEARLRGMYDAFNARDIDAVLAAMTDDVDWPNGWEGGRVRGTEAVRAYWTRQWAAIDPGVEPVGVATRPDGTVAVDVDQVVRDLDGAVVARGRVVHVYTLRDGRIARMDIEEGGADRS
jgi:hypothetical protein